MSELNLTREAPDDELADLPENVKLDEDEVVLYKYLCSIRFFCVLKIIAFTLFIWPPCALFLESGTLMKIKVNFCKTVHGLIKVMIWMVF